MSRKRQISLDTLTKSIGPMSPKDIKDLQSWLDADWESHDQDRQMINLVRRLLDTVEDLKEQRNEDQRHGDSK